MLLNKSDNRNPSDLTVSASTPHPPSTMSTSATRPDFSITFLRHPQAGSHTFEAFRELTSLGEQQLATIVNKLHGYAFDEYRLTPTARTAAVAKALIEDGHARLSFSIIRGLYPEPELEPEIWAMFKEVTRGNAPIDYKNHREYRLFANHCGKAARTLIPSTSKNILVIGHGTLSQQIAACICDELDQADLGEEIERIMMNECDLLKVIWKDGQLSWSFDPLGKSTEV